MANIIVNIAKNLTEEQVSRLAARMLQPKRLNDTQTWGFITTWKCKPEDDIMDKVTYSRDVDAYGSNLVTDWYVRAELVVVSFTTDSDLVSEVHLKEGHVDANSVPIRVTIL